MTTNTTSTINNTRTATYFTVDHFKKQIIGTEQKHFSPFDIEMIKDDAEMMVDDAAAIIGGSGSVAEYQFRSWKRLCNTAA